MDGIEALDDRRMTFAASDQGTDADILRALRQADAATAPPPCFQVSLKRQFMNQFGEMVAGDAVGGGHFVQLKEILLERPIHENAKGVIAENTQMHAVENSG